MSPGAIEREGRECAAADILQATGVLQDRGPMKTIVECSAVLLDRQEKRDPIKHTKEALLNLIGGQVQAPPPPIGRSGGLSCKHSRLMKKTRN